MYAIPSFIHLLRLSPAVLSLPRAFSLLLPPPAFLPHSSALFYRAVTWTIDHARWSARSRKRKTKMNGPRKRKRERERAPARAELTLSWSPPPLSHLSFRSAAFSKLPADRFRQHRCKRRLAFVPAKPANSCLRLN